MASTPKLGIILPEGEGDLDGRTPRWSDYVAMATLIEEAGFDSLWFVDHLIYRNDASGRPPREPGSAGQSLRRLPRQPAGSRLAPW